MSRVVWIVIDSVGIGALPDSEKFGDKGVNTLGNIVKAHSDIKIPNMRKLGIGNIDGVDFMQSVENPVGTSENVQRYLKEKIQQQDIGK